MVQPEASGLAAEIIVVLIPLTVGEVVQQWMRQIWVTLSKVLIPLTVGEVVQLQC